MGRLIEMNIVMTSSDLYSKLAITTFKSLFINNKDVDEIVIYYIGDKLTDESRNNLINLVNEYDSAEHGRKIIFAPMPDHFDKLTGSNRNGQTVYCYCYFQDLLGLQRHQRRMGIRTCPNYMCIVHSLHQGFCISLDGWIRQN